MFLTNQTIVPGTTSTSWRNGATFRVDPVPWWIWSKSFGYGKFDWDLFNAGFVEAFQENGQPESFPSLSSAYLPSSDLELLMPSSDEAAVETEDTRLFDKEDTKQYKRGRGRPKLQLGKGENAAGVSLPFAIQKSFFYWELW
jgi:hypothetical protein